MYSRSLYVLALALAFTASACADDEVITPGTKGSLEVSSDPAGASVELDNVASGKVTPATFWELSGRHDVVVRLERDGIAYGYRTQVEVRSDSLHRISGPLMFRCNLGDTSCLLGASRYRDLGRLRMASNATGALLVRQAAGLGILWPAGSAGSSSSYASIGMPMIAMVAGSRDTLALGIYDYQYLAGRPEPMYSTTMEGATFRQSTWIVPPTNILLTGAPTVRGIEVIEELVGSVNSDIVYLKLTFRNITNRDTYRAVDPLVPNSGLTFTRVYLGFAMDADIGESSDDLITYEPPLEMVYTYDSNFREPSFNAASAFAPGLIGLRMIAKPENTTTVMNGWPGTFGTVSGDWAAGSINEPAGHGILSGSRSFLPDEPGASIGYTPGTPGDFRMSVSAGPVTLAPGDSAQVTVAIVLAAPVAGEFTSGQQVLPGSPSVQDRPIRRIAATLFTNAQPTASPKRSTSSVF